MRLLALTISALFFSTSFAEWSPCGPRPLRWTYGVAVATEDASVTLVVGTTGSIDDVGAWRTENGGKSWQPFFLDDSAELVPDRLFFARTTEANYASVGVDLYESRDDGASWRKTGTVADPEFPLEQVSLYSLALTSDEIIAGVGNQISRQTGGLFHSADGGKTWKAYPELIGRTVYDILVIDDETILAATHRLILRTLDGGLTWEEVGPPGVEARFRDLALDGRTGAIYGATSGRGVWRSTDGGASWVARNRGLTVPTPYSVEVDPLRPGVVWAGISGGGLFRSANEGERWSRSGDVDAQTMVSGIHFFGEESEHGLMKTGDGLYCRGIAPR